MKYISVLFMGENIALVVLRSINSVDAPPIIQW